MSSTYIDMTEEELNAETKLAERCDIESHHEPTDRIRIVSRHGNWQNANLEYFNKSLQTEDKILLKDFIHVDTYCRLGTISQVWRVQGFICLSNLLDYVEESFQKEFMVEAFQHLLEKIVFDKQYDEFCIINYKGKTYIKIIEYDATHRVL